MSARHLPPVPGSHRQIRIVEEPVTATSPRDEPARLMDATLGSGASGQDE